MVFGGGANRVVALENVTLEIPEGRFVCLVGASGCGKTTMLNLVAELEQPSVGKVTSTGQCALMFQESALFGWLTMSRNVELALKLRGMKGRGARRAEANRLLEMVHLEDFSRSRPMRSPVGCANVARLLARSPRSLRSC